MKERKNLKRIISLLLIILEVRLTGIIGNTVNMKGVLNYNKIVENFSDFLDEQGITDPQHIYEYYNYAMWNGYFSKDHELKYSVDRKIYIDNPGISIMSGNAVCLNYADMLSLIFKEMGFNSYMAMCHVDSDNVSIERIRTDKNIVRKINPGSSEALDRLFKNFFINGITKIFGNHAITCVENDGEIYIFDPTNLVYLNKTGINDINIVNGTGKFDLRYFSSLLYDNMNIFKLIPSTNNKDYNLEIVDKEEIKVNIEALEKFYNENEEYINTVDEINERGTETGMIELMLYSIVAAFIISSIKSRIKYIARKHEDEEIKDLFPLLKEYFNEKNINTEFEVLRNYGLINKKLGIKNNLLKDIYIKLMNITNRLINNDNYYTFMLFLLLEELGYKANIVYLKRYHGIIKKEVKLIKYYSNNVYYLYDPEINELIYEEDGIYYSKNKDYKYKSKDNYLSELDIETLHTKEQLENKMNDENTLLSKENIKELKKSKILR